ncbi:MAG: DsbA family protein [Deltaproteobacteria bacterium]|nr:DsbA family protein [Deltaproteobacteria bacterium]
MKREFQIRVQWLAFPLHPETPPEGRSLKDLFAGRNIDLPQMLSHLSQEAQRLALPFGDRQKTYNSRRAQELAKWAEQMGKGDVFHDAVFRAYFAQGHNIFNMDTLAKIADSVGLDQAATRDVIDCGSFKAAVDRDWERAYQSGIRAVPTFIIGGQSVVGAQPYHVLKKMVRHISDNA